MSEKTAELMTPYAASKVANKWLEEKAKEAGVQAKKLPPQMFYTYVNKGYIKSVEKDGKRCVQLEALKDWFDNKYKQSKKTKQEVVEFDNDGTVGEWN